MTESGTRAVSWEIADLSRQDAVRDLATRLRARLPRIHVLANNAGAMFLDRAETAEGLERTFTLNHLNYFTLTMLLLDRLAAAATSGAPARILSVSSRAHRDARLNLDDLQMKRTFSGWRAYANSKLCNILFTRALARRLDPSRAVAHSLHPGVVSTRFGVNNGRRGRVLRGLMDVIAISPARGADTLVWLSHASAALSDSGSYWVRRTRRLPSEAAQSDVDSERLWMASSALAGVDADALIRDAGLWIGGGS
jgi:NAD(P)-dependent dehydrogenase (short-subunit alcohol dehydrogenase family)